MSLNYAKNFDRDICKASEFIDLLIVEENESYIIAGRVSWVQSWKQESQEDQIADLRNAIVSGRGKIVGETIREQSGKDPRLWRDLFDEAHKKNAIVVFCDPSRILRAKDFHSHNKRDAQPSRSEWEWLMSIAQGVKIATLIHPDSTPQEIERYQKDRGRRMKGNVGGRPMKRKKRKLKWKSRAIEVHRTGLSFRDTTEILVGEGIGKIAHTTIARWIKEEKGSTQLPRE